MIAREKAGHRLTVVVAHSAAYSAKVLAGVQELYNSGIQSDKGLDRKAQSREFTHKNLPSLLKPVSTLRAKIFRIGLGLVSLSSRPTCCVAGKIDLSWGLFHA